MAEKRFRVHSRSHYYAGDLEFVVPEEEDYTYESVRLEWKGYHGGSATIDLSWDEVEELRAIFHSALDLKPVWWT